MPARPPIRSTLPTTALVLALALAGCADTNRLLAHRTAAAAATTTTTSTTAATPSAESVYLARLGAEQQKLASAEQQIPTNPRTPAALARSIDLLHAAVHELADGLAAITPPASVAPLHARLVTIMRTYASQLTRASRLATTPGAERRAGRLLLTSTNTASQAFTATIGQIDTTLGGS